MHYQTILEFKKEDPFVNSDKCQNLTLSLPSYYMIVHFLRYLTKLFIFLQDNYFGCKILNYFSSNNKKWTTPFSLEMEINQWSALTNIYNIPNWQSLTLLTFPILQNIWICKRNYSQGSSSKGCGGSWARNSAQLPPPSHIKTSTTTKKPAALPFQKTCRRATWWST